MATESCVETSPSLTCTTVILCNAPLVKTSCGGRLLDGHFEAELLEPLDAPQCNRLAALRVQVRGAEVLEVGAVLEHPVDGKQNRVGDCNASTFPSPPRSKAVVAGREEVRLATPRPNSPHRYFDHIRP